ncbi:methyl-accepting chemotaxis protein [Asticcacaulis sp. EMRT-3]|uniref:methyl-accepting chemotaxis protein n=1 Tax=Asticcacaulis sp. EMRT-3 TaxID=3040349 RepID=UPI0024AF2E66|nr:methyl-accepting chemotaxis protein [Asticcacaulis sp. EMRT-3]MDI7773996.1 methyl-accepting chemotaxis protein [Asticcacaulis sp. EMRT-3]
MNAPSPLSVQRSVSGSVSQNVSLADIIAQTARAKNVTANKVRDIRQVTSKLRILALNALIEAKHAGEAGHGFSVVADEVRGISGEVETLARDLGHEIVTLDNLTQDLAQQSQGTRMTDLALNAIEIIDRNLYERTCDVRWWATDAALVDQAAEPSPKRADYACERLGVILDSYTVYIDLWLCDLEGRVIANGRPNQHRVIGTDVRDRLWFSRALNLRSGQDFAVADVTTEPLLGGAQIATYATGVRRDGRADGELIGILGIHFDWQPQAQTIVEGVRLTDDEKARTRVLLTDAQGLVIAASDGKGVLSEHVRLRTSGQKSGHYLDAHDNRMVAFHRTPGYETYAGLGWYGVIVQKAME